MNSDHIINIVRHERVDDENPDYSEPEQLKVQLTDGVSVKIEGDAIPPFMEAIASINRLLSPPPIVINHGPANLR